VAVPELWRQRSHLELAIDGMGPAIGEAGSLTTRLAPSRDGLDMCAPRNQQAAQHGLQPTAADEIMSRRG
jgi:hypothetical protein